MGLSREICHRNLSGSVDPVRCPEMDLFLCILGLRTANGQMEPPRVIFHIANWKRWPIGRSIIYHDDLPIQNARDFLWLLVGG